MAEHLYEDERGDDDTAKARVTLFPATGIVRRRLDQCLVGDPATDGVGIIGGDLYAGVNDIETFPDNDQGAAFIMGFERPPVDNAAFLLQLVGEVLLGDGFIHWALPDLRLGSSSPL